MMAQRQDSGSADPHDIIPDGVDPDVLLEPFRDMSYGPHHERKRCCRCKGVNIHEKKMASTGPGNRRPRKYRCHTCKFHQDILLPPIAEETDPETIVERLALPEDDDTPRYRNGTYERLREATARRNNGEGLDAIAAALGVTRSTVVYYARVGRHADERLLAAVDDGYLSAAAVGELIREEDPRRRWRLAEAAIEGYWGSRKIREERENDADDWETERPDGWLKQFYEDAQEVDLE